MAVLAKLISANIGSNFAQKFTALKEWATQCTTEKKDFRLSLISLKVLVVDLTSTVVEIFNLKIIFYVVGTTNKFMVAFLSFNIQRKPITVSRKYR